MLSLYNKFTIFYFEFQGFRVWPSNNNDLNPKKTNYWASRSCRFLGSRGIARTTLDVGLRVSRASDFGCEDLGF